MQSNIILKFVIFRRVYSSTIHIPDIHMEWHQIWYRRLLKHVNTILQVEGIDIIRNDSLQLTNVRTSTNIASTKCLTYITALWGKAFQPHLYLCQISYETASSSNVTHRGIVTAYGVTDPDHHSPIRRQIITRISGYILLIGATEAKFIETWIKVR